MSKRTQPQWRIHPEGSKPQLRLYNSLTRRKEIFVPQNGNKVLWYSCGPTVYDASHMGHARSYISFDILRRVLSDYFRYDVTYVMNITDIDDKIIKRARQNYLFDRYIAENNTVEDVLGFLNEVSLALTDTKQQNMNNAEKCCVIDKMLNSLHSVISTLTKNNIADGDRGTDVLKKLLDDVRDPISEYLDGKNGCSVTENAIFSSLPKYWENEFLKDMELLNVKYPNVLTRVSEYVPEIIDYIQKIIMLGYAYESNSSVYFDVEAFDSRPNHFYAKLVPEAYGDTRSLQEGEGDLTSAEKGEKKSPNDFALWKSSKPGEPWWDSPWGKGRPGWHIECSVMASIVLGETLDIHTGGVDLKFPHHDNEIAQAEAYYDKDQWVNYFLHSGHLTIAGCKMSKSLKNFITIKDALKKHTSRQLRLAFLLHSWKDTLDYSDSTMEMAVSYEKLLNEFFLTVKDLIEQCNPMTHVEKPTTADLKLLLRFNEVRDNIHEALCDNIDTRKVLETVREFISYCNVHIRDCGGSPSNVVLLFDIARCITNYFQIFGVIPENNTIGFPFLGIGSSHTNSELEKILMPYLKVLADFRYSIRSEALKIKHTDILKLCDHLRDDTLTKMGVRLEDREGKSSAVKLVDKETLLREKEEKEKAERDKQMEKQKKLEEQAKKEMLRKTPPDTIFKLETDKYSKFDEKGIPTHDVEGKEISKGLTKKLQKLQFQHEKKYKEYLASLQDT